MKIEIGEIDASDESKGIKVGHLSQKIDNARRWTWC